MQLKHENILCRAENGSLVFIHASICEGIPCWSIVIPIAYNLPRHVFIGCHSHGIKRKMMPRRCKILSVKAKENVEFKIEEKELKSKKRQCYNCLLQKKNL